MQTALIWAARLALLVVLVVCASGALDPQHDVNRSVPPPDVVEHVMYGYLLTLLSLASLPRVNPWLIGGAYLLAGVGFETAQVFRLVAGNFEWKDMAANVVGVAAALAPFALARARSAKVDPGFAIRTRSRS
ncbi:MAG: hypothetical protein ACK41C_12500 [Phenylobacterium sp.]|uniref:hypothetical protein n=1 Tax=Phenylobacterium sp. TaxID=1871053 RepID=UPI00391BC559